MCVPLCSIQKGRSCLHRSWFAQISCLWEAVDGFSDFKVDETFVCMLSKVILAYCGVRENVAFSCIQNIPLAFLGRHF